MQWCGVYHVYSMIFSVWMTMNFIIIVETSHFPLLCHFVKRHFVRRENARRELYLSLASSPLPFYLHPSLFPPLPFSVSIVLPCCTPFPQQIIYATENQACVVYLIDFHVYMNRLYLQMQSLVDNFSASVALNSLSRLCKPHNTQFFNFYSMFLSISNTTNDVNAKFAVNVNKQLRKKYTQPKQREKKTKINWNHWKKKPSNQQTVYSNPE